MKTADRNELDAKITALESAEGHLEQVYKALSKRGYRSSNADFHVPAQEELDRLHEIINIGLDRAYADRARDDRRKGGVA